MGFFNKPNSEGTTDPVVENNLDSSQATTQVEAGITTEAVITPELQAEIDRLAEEKAALLTEEKLKEVIPKAKAEKERTLDEKLEKVEALLEEMSIKQSNIVAPEYENFVKFEAKQQGISVEEFVNKNPQYKNKKPIVVSQQQQNENAVKISEQQAKFFELLKQKF